MNDLNRKVAEARGWIRHEDDDGWNNPQNGMFYPDYYVNFQTNIAQAMELLEEFPSWEIELHKGQYYCMINKLDECGEIFCCELCISDHKSLTKAICRAYLKAKEKEAQDARHINVREP